MAVELIINFKIPTKSLTVFFKIDRPNNNKLKSTHTNKSTMIENEEYFYGVTLSGSNSSVTWDGFGKAGGDEVPRTHKLVIKNLLLGHEAKEDEYNVVEVQTSSLNDEVKIPIAVLKSGQVRSMRPHLEFPEPPVVLKLIEGSGPVHIHGLHLIGAEEMDEEMEIEMMHESEGEEDDDEEADIPRKKLKLANNGKAKSSNKPPKKN